MINAYHSSCYFESHEVICTIFIMKWEALTKMESCFKWKMKEFLVFFVCERKMEQVLCGVEKKEQNHYFIRI